MQDQPRHYRGLIRHTYGMPTVTREALSSPTVCRPRMSMIALIVPKQHLMLRLRADMMLVKMKDKRDMSPRAKSASDQQKTHPASLSLQHKTANRISNGQIRQREGRSGHHTATP